MSSSKHIIISREFSDFSIDLIWAGLARHFGEDAMIDYPVRAKHRAGKPILVGNDEKDYGAERGSLCYTGLNFSKWTRQEIICKVDFSSSYVWLDETSESYLHYLELFGTFPSNRRPKTIVVAGHDSFRGNPIETAQRFGSSLAAMFVDDWKNEYDTIPNTHLINLSSNFDHLWEVENREKFLSEKKYDICFIGYNSNPLRKIVIDHVKSKWSHLNNRIIFEERRNEFSSFVRHAELFRGMAQSKICINIPGASTCGRALRFYEIPYVGSFMLSMNFPAKLLYPFENGVHCKYFYDFDSLDIEIENALLMDKETESIAAAGHLHACKYHTIDSRIQYMLSKLGNK